jgi:hypothetical protein
MTWETRKNRGRYYTRSRRKNGHVVREYIGAGQIGEAAAAADAYDRGQRKAESERLRAQVVAWREADALLDHLATATALLARAALEKAGYHQHRRGKWRKRRRGQQQPIV